MKIPAILGTSGAYLLAGIVTTAWVAHRGQVGKPHWTGFGQTGGAASGVIQTALLWPVAVVMNLKAKAVPAAAAA